MSKTILVALSESTSDIVLATAIDTARSQGAHLAVLNIIDPAPYIAMTADHMCGLLFESLEALGLETAHPIAHALDDAGCPAQVQTAMLSIGETTVARKIASFAEEIGADLIIIGARQSRWPSWLCANIPAAIQRATATPLQIVAQTIAAAPAYGRQSTARQYVVHHHS